MSIESRGNYIVIEHEAQGYYAFPSILKTHRNRSKQYLRFLDYKQGKPVVTKGTDKY